MPILNDSALQAAVTVVPFAEQVRVHYQALLYQWMGVFFFGGFVFGFLICYMAYTWLLRKKQG